MPYHEAFATHHAAAAAKLREAAELSSDPEFARYLRLRAEALETDEYQASDFAWMDMKNNPIDVVIGPIETYEDALFGYKAGHEGYVLIKDMEWSDRLSRFAALLPDLQKGLPVEAKYKAETPGTDADLNAYDVVYYAGEANTGGKTIAINLPNDEQVQLQKGTRRLQLKNAMQAKFDKIMVPIADALIVDDQHAHVGFDAFFQNTMFHEVAHGLGIKNTINGKGTVRTALKDHASALEEEKADVVGLYMVKQLYDRGELDRRLHRGQLHHVPGRPLPLGALRRRRRARQGQHGDVQLLPGSGRVREGRGEREVPRRLPEDGRGGGRAGRAHHPAPG